MAPPRLTVGALFQDRLYLAAFAAGVLVLLGLAWFTFATGPSTESNAKPFTHMHCTACRAEVIYNAKLAGRNCNECDGGGVYEPTVGSINDENFNDGSGAGGIILFVILAIIDIQALVYLGYRRLDLLRERAEEAHKRTMVARCPFCRRKVGFPAFKAGTWTTCSQCKTAYALPADAAEAI